MSSIRIGSYYEVPATDYEQAPLISWREFYDFRNHTLRVLRRFGSAGPMGEVNLFADGDEPEFDHNSVRNPDFFVVDDMYNEHDQLSIVECEPKFITKDLIESLNEMALGFPGWWISFSLGDSGLRISAGTLLKGGRRFWDCDTVEQVAERCGRPVDFGPAGPFPEAMYPLWAAVISGEYGSSIPHADPPDRQWTEAIKSLRHMAARKEGGRLNCFQYGQIRHDIHPAIRGQLAKRFLSEMSSFSSEHIENARRNLLEDMATALLDSPNPHDGRTFLSSLSSGQKAAVGKIEDKEIVYWWSQLLHYARESNEQLNFAVEVELRSLLAGSNPLIQLSAIFGLARLRVGDIASVVDDGFKANQRWLLNPELTKWLLKLRGGASGYPEKSFLA